MKITLKKDVINLSEAAEAETMRKEWNEYFKDKTFLQLIVDTAIRSNVKTSEYGYHDSNKILDIESVEICKNHYELTVWIKCTVKYDLDIIIEMDFDGMQALQYFDGEKVDAYIQYFKRNK